MVDKMSISNFRILKVAIAGYFAVAVFVATFGFIHSFEDLESHIALLIAATVASPLVIAFIWERLTKIKVGDFELDLKEVSPPKTHALPALLGFEIGFSETPVSPLGQAPPIDIAREDLTLGSSLTPEILKQIKSAISQAEGAKLAELDLGKGNTWWVTRLYLLSALADDYTGIQQLLFLESRNGRDRCFVGMATPASIRYELTIAYPLLEQAYREAFRVCFVDAHTTEDILLQQVECVIENFGIYLQQYKPDYLRLASEAELQEIGKVEWVTRHIISRSLQIAPEASCVEWTGGIVTPLLLQQIIDRPSQFVALVDHGQVKLVVDRIELAIRFSKSILKQKLE